MFLQIFADGTVIDSEGVHRSRSAELRPIAEPSRIGELGRLRGHCGTPSSDFIEEVHVIVYERRLGRLSRTRSRTPATPRAAITGSANLHTVIENIQAKLSHQPGMAAAAPGATNPAPNIGGPAPLSNHAAPPLPDPGAGSGSVPPSGDVIPLTPLPSR